MSSNQQNFSDKGIAMDGAPLKPLNESTPQPALRTQKHHKIIQVILQNFKQKIQSLKNNGW